MRFDRFERDWIDLEAVRRERFESTLTEEVSMRQAERIEEARAHLLGERPAGRRGDDDARDHVVAVGVTPTLRGRAGRRWDAVQHVRNRKIVAPIIVVGERLGEPARVRKQLAHRHASEEGEPGRQVLREPRINRNVETHNPVAVEIERERGHIILRDTRDSELIVRSNRPSPCKIREARNREHLATLEDDGDACARNVPRREESINRLLDTTAQRRPAIRRAARTRDTDRKEKQREPPTRAT